ncbi:unnamed protein product [Spodoptera littoralis]|uniref:Actin n=1 Tax=Spodoptera littoralis TaxID=7109 RepID=A0A9P0II22_SPOLI|nr:unnamed protein product [Spodoptera littoralis]CAH1647343.1 unnamed protein product [Spodoptera littoralis]
MSSDFLGVVLDAGSQSLKAGFAGEPSPRTMVPNIVGRFRRDGLMDGIPIVYCGTQAIKNRGISKLVYPVKEGRIEDWDEMEKLWHHVFYKELHVPPECTKIMHSVHPLTSKNDNQKMAEILFEMFAIDSLYIAQSTALALNAYGRTSGVVLECGHFCSYVAPVFEGFPLKHATITSPVTGNMLTKRLQNLMFKAGYSLTTPYELDLIEKIKKDTCYLSQNYDKELAEASGYDSKIKYKLPDGQDLLLGEERFLCPEIFFKPELEELKCKNIIETICHGIDLCDLDFRPMFYSNIVCSGGATMTPGFVERLKKELTNSLKKASRDVRPHVEAIPVRQFAAWVGGSMLASFPNLQGFWLTKEEYEDSGSDLVKSKFF